MLKSIQRQEKLLDNYVGLKQFLITRGMNFQQPFDVIKGQATTLSTLLKTYYNSQYNVYIMQLRERCGKYTYRYIKVNGYRNVKDLPLDSFVRTYWTTTCAFHSKASLDRIVHTDSFVVLLTPCNLIGCTEEDKVNYKILEEAITSKPSYMVSRFMESWYSKDKYNRITFSFSNSRTYLDKSGYIIDKFKKDLLTRVRQYKENKVKNVGLNYRHFITLMDKYKMFNQSLMDNIGSDYISRTSYEASDIFREVNRMYRLIKNQQAEYYSSVKDLDHNINNLICKIDNYIINLQEW